jgi:hypothetical protein
VILRRHLQALPTDPDQDQQIGTLTETFAAIEWRAAGNRGDRHRGRRN